MNEVINISEIVSLPTGNKDILNLNYNIVVKERNNQHIFFNDITHHKSLTIYECFNCAIYINESELQCFNQVLIMNCKNIQLCFHKNINKLNISNSNYVDITSFYYINDIAINTSADVCINTVKQKIHGIPILIAGAFDININIVNDKKYSLLCNMFFEGFLNMYSLYHKKFHYKRIKVKQHLIDTKTFT